MQEQQHPHQEANPNNPNNNNNKKNNHQKSTVFDLFDIPKDDDVLCGQDKTFQNHVGNQFYRNLIANAALDYEICTSKQAKMNITKCVVQRIRGKGGRFLKRKDGIGCGWQQLTEAQARDKTSHALRYYQKTRMENNTEQPSSSPPVPQLPSGTGAAMAVSNSQQQQRFGSTIQQPSCNDTLKSEDLNLILNHAIEAAWGVDKKRTTTASSSAPPTTTGLFDRMICDNNNNNARDTDMVIESIVQSGPAQPLQPTLLQHSAMHHESIDNNNNNTLRADDLSILLLNHATKERRCSKMSIGNNSVTSTQPMDTLKSDDLNRILNNNATIDSLSSLMATAIL